MYSLDLQSALEFVVLRQRSGPFHIEASVVGPRWLVDALGHYAQIVDSPDHLIALGLEQQELLDLLQERNPKSVVIVSAGPLARVLRPLRAHAVSIPSALPARQWQSLGYKRLQSRGFQGPGSIIWALGEWLARRLSRPELADRCRIAMQQTAPSSRAGFALSSIRMDEYGRAQ